MGAGSLKRIGVVVALKQSERASGVHSTLPRAIWTICQAAELKLPLRAAAGGVHRSAARVLLPRRPTGSLPCGTASPSQAPSTLSILWAWSPWAAGAPVFVSIRDAMPSKARCAAGLSVQRIERLWDGWVEGGRASFVWRRHAGCDVARPVCLCEREVAAIPGG